MRSPIEEFFYGEYAPHLKSSLPQGMSSEIDSLEIRLMELLEGEQKKLLIEYSIAYSKALGCADANRFIDGFRTGALMMLSVCTENLAFPYADT